MVPTVAVDVRHSRQTGGPRGRLPDRVADLTPRSVCCEGDVRQRS